MRKPTFIALIAAVGVLSGAGVALGGQGATNEKGDFIALDVAVSPPVAGTAKAPRGVGVSLDSFLGNRINGNTPSTNNSVLVRFSKGFKENGLRFPGCKINPTDFTVCPKSTQVGTGTAEASIAGTGGAPPTFVPAKLAVYNGKPYGQSKAPTMIFTATLNGTPCGRAGLQDPAGSRGVPMGSCSTTSSFRARPPLPSR